MNTIALAGRRVVRRAWKYRAYLAFFLAGLLLRDSVRVALALVRLVGRVRRGLELVRREEHITRLFDGDEPATRNHEHVTEP
jgi:hypothetical protein